MKHIDMRYHFIRECITDGSIDLKLIGTNDMAADVLMKVPAVNKHEHFLSNAQDGDSHLEKQWMSDCGGVLQVEGSLSLCHWGLSATNVVGWQGSTGIHFLFFPCPFLLSSCLTVNY